MPGAGGAAAAARCPGGRQCRSGGPRCPAVPPARSVPGLPRRKPAPGVPHGPAATSRIAAVPVPDPRTPACPGVGATGATARPAPPAPRRAAGTAAREVAGGCPSFSPGCEGGAGEPRRGALRAGWEELGTAAGS